MLRKIKSEVGDNDSPLSTPHSDLQPDRQNVAEVVNSSKPKLPAPSAKISVSELDVEAVASPHKMGEAGT